MNIKIISLVLPIILVFPSIIFAGDIKIENPDALKFTVNLIDENYNEKTFDVLGYTTLTVPDNNSKSYQEIQIVSEEAEKKPTLPDPVQLNGSYDINTKTWHSSHDINHKKWYLKTIKDDESQKITITVEGSPK